MAKDQVQITFKVFNEEFKKGLSEIREGTTRLNREFRLQKEQMKLTGSESDKLKTQIGYLNDRYKQAQDRVKLTEEQLSKAKKTFGENSTEVKKLEDELMNARIEEQRFANQLQVTSQELKEAESKALQFSKSLREIGGGMQEAGKKISDTGQKLTTRLTLPIVGAGVAAGKMSMDFNNSMANIATLIPGENQRLLALKDDIRNVAIVAGKSTDDIAAGTYDVISAYGDAADTMDKVEINAKAAAAGMASTSDALNLSSAIMKGYGDTTAEANKKVMDLSFMTLKLGQTSFPELASSMGKVVPTSNELGISQEQLFAVFATATGVTGNASEVSTQYQGALKALMAPTKDMTKLMKGLGVENGQAMIEQYGLIGSMEKIVEASKKSGVPLQKYIGSIQGQVLALALAGEQNDVYKDKLKELMDSSGAMDEAFKEQTEGINKTGFTFEQAMIKMQVAGQKFGDAMAPMIAKLSDLFSQWADRLNNLSPAQMDNIIKISMMVAAIGPALVIIGKVISIAGGLISVIGTVSGAIGVVTTGAAAATPAIGGLATAFTALSGPIGWVVAGAAALTVGGIALANHLKKDSIPAVELFGDGVSDTTEKAVGGFLDLNDQATLALKELSWSGKEVTKDMADGIVGNFSQMSTQVQEKLDEQHTESLSKMQEFLANSKGLSQEEQEATLNNMIEGHEQKKQAIVDGETRIKEIMEQASAEKRALSRTEQEEINSIQQNMVDTGIQVLSENEVESKLIMERMKEQGGQMSALQASEVVQNSLEQKEGAIQAAEEQYDEVMKEIIRQRDESGTISEEQAQKLIDEAQRQRDETVASANKMHIDVITEAKAQAGEHVNQVDWTTGEIKSKGDILLENTKETFRKIGKSISDTWESARKATSDSWNNMNKTIDEKGGGIKGFIGFVGEEISKSWKSNWEAMDKLSGGKLGDMLTDVKDKMGSIKESIENSKLAQAWDKVWNFKLPKIKLPKFQMTGSFNLMPPSIPKVSVKWMSEGGIFRSPTILGGVGVGDAYKGIGSNAEVVAPLTDLIGMIEDAVQPIHEVQPAHATVINFNGNYSFRDQDDIDYFLNQAELKAKRREV